MQFTRDRRRAAVSTAVIAGVVVAVVAVAAFGAYLARAPSPQASSSTTSQTGSSSATQLATITTPTSSNPSTTSSTSTSTSASKQSTASTTSSSSSSTAASTSSAFSFGFAFAVVPRLVLMTPGSNETYSLLTLQPLPAASSGNETVTLNSTAPSGLVFTLSPSSVELTTDSRVFVGMKIISSAGLTPGDYKVTVGAKYGTSSMTFDIPVRVVQYLVLLQENSYNPSAITMKQGGTVYWINLDAPADSAGGNAGADPEVHDVDFLSGSSAESPDLMHYSEYSLTFTDPGTYTYHCSFHPLAMNGVITVTSG